MHVYTLGRACALAVRSACGILTPWALSSGRYGSHCVPARSSWHLGRHGHSKSPNSTKTALFFCWPGAMAYTHPLARARRTGRSVIEDWEGAQVDNSRRTAFVVGVLFIITFITAIAGRLLYGPVLDDPNYIVSAGADTQIAFGVLFELLLIIANVGTALWLFPILKRQHEALSLSYVAARLLESTFIAMGIVSLLGILTLRQEGADPGSLVPVGESLVAMNNWTFLLGPGFVVGIGNGLILGYLMFRSGLVPRGMAMLGLIGGPLATASGIAVLLGVIEQDSAAQVIATIPEILWEASLGLYLTFNGFRPSPILSGDIGAAGVDAA
jgi:hypothetical protein